jgi:fructosamine-3-kinase
MAQVDAALEDFLIKQKLSAPHETAQWTSLTGGVSSDIWRVDFADRTLCIKRALPKLKVSADWNASTDRSNNEWAWLTFAKSVCPDAVPKLLAHDSDQHIFAMSFLPPDDYPVWKSQLLRGQVDPLMAMKMGHLLGRLHAASAGKAAIAAQFQTLENFSALRIEPYLLATARCHPDIGTQLTDLAQQLASKKIALVHGDVSPKNILIGHSEPVLLDAECAWYGDPAFDMAFLLNHLLLKCLVMPAACSKYLDAIACVSKAYFDEIQANPWELRADLERRIAGLLPALMLARVDGKSPVEYLTSGVEKNLVRQFARALIVQPHLQILPIALQWVRCVQTHAAGHGLA